MEKPEKSGVESTKKVMLVIEDVGSEANFKFTIEGDIDRLDGKTPLKDLTAAEFWGHNLFHLCNDHLQRHGDIRNTGGENV